MGWGIGSSGAFSPSWPLRDGSRSDPELDAALDAGLVSQASPCKAAATPGAMKRRVKSEHRVATHAAAGKLPAIVEAFEKGKKASSKGEIVALIKDWDLPREAIAAQWLNEVVVWDALLQRLLSRIRLGIPSPRH